MLQKACSPAASFRRRLQVTALTICVMYLWRFLSAATPQRRKRGSKEVSVTASRAADTIIYKPPGRLQRPLIRRSLSDSFQIRDEPGRKFVFDQCLKKNKKKPTHAGGSACNDVRMTAGGGEECVFRDGLTDEAGKFVWFGGGKKKPLQRQGPSWISPITPDLKGVILWVIE